MLVVAPGSLVALNTLTDEEGHEEDVQFEVTPGETVDPAAGYFSSDGEAYVTVGFDPVYTIRVYHDKDGNGVWGGNDPFVDATVVTPVAIDHLRIFIDAVEWAPGEIANGEIM
ncbi:MAG: hypothetical protein HY719_12615, partial [Planctomycetes bacterium]|nr:hypothetical protein [Planctomycetota bacterium]